MRFRSEITSSGQVFAVAGTNTVSFGIVAPDAARSGLLGYAVARRDVGSDQWRVMDGFKVFESVVPKPKKGLRVSTYDHPVQSFMWDDFTCRARPPLRATCSTRSRATPGNLDLPATPRSSIAVRTEPLYGGEHDVFFNRGVASSQAYTEQFGNTPIDELGDRQKRRRSGLAQPRPRRRPAAVHRRVPAGRPAAGLLLRVPLPSPRRRRWPRPSTAASTSS